MSTSSNNTPIDRLSFHQGHDSAIAYTINGKFYNISIEKIRKIRFGYFLKNESVYYAGKSTSVLNHVQDIIGDHKFDEIILPRNSYYRLDLKSEGEVGTVKSLLTRFLKPEGRTVISCPHHQSHAELGLATSPFDKALIITTDGGGDSEFFTVSIGDRKKGIRQIMSKQLNLGGLYLSGCSFVSEIEGVMYPTFAGKGMGLVARGDTILQGVRRFLKHIFEPNNAPRATEVFSRTEGERIRGFERLRKILGDGIVKDLFKDLGDSPMNKAPKLTSGKRSYDLMYTTQKTFEEIFDIHVDPFLEEYKDLPVIISGGCALNVLNNERIKKKIYPKRVFIPSAPCDSGLALGYVLERDRPQTQIDLHNSSPFVDDLNTLDHLKSTREHKIVSNKDIADLLSQGKIIGYMQGPSETGPRALGYRSILCDPSYPNMREMLNDKIKHREWFRPFAPVCLLKHANKYFDSPTFDNMEFMSFAVDVKEDAKTKLPAIVHVDGSARLQTVTKTSSPYLYKLLIEYTKQTGKHVLLNTSLNSWGDPIANTIERGLEILDKTEMDYLVVDDVLFS